MMNEGNKERVASVYQNEVIYMPINKKEKASRKISLSTIIVSLIFKLNSLDISYYWIRYQSLSI